MNAVQLMVVFYCHDQMDHLMPLGTFVLDISWSETQAQLATSPKPLRVKQKYRRMLMKQLVGGTCQIFYLHVLISWPEWPLLFNLLNVTGIRTISHVALVYISLMNLYVRHLKERFVILICLRVCVFVTRFRFISFSCYFIIYCEYILKTRWVMSRK